MSSDVDGNEKQAQDACNSALRRGRAGCRMRLDGPINRRFDPSVFAQIDDDVLVVDVAGVERITSFGVREWMRGLASSRATTLIFVNMRPALVSQANMVAGFCGNGCIVSFFVPFACDDCGHEREVLVDVRDTGGRVDAVEPEPMACESCGGESVFDDLPESYFHHLAQQPAPVVSDAVAELISGNFADAAAPPFKVKKDIDDEVTGLWLSGVLKRNVRIRRLTAGLEGLVVVVCDRIVIRDHERFGELIDSLIAQPDAAVWIGRASADALLSLEDKTAQALRGRVVLVSVGAPCSFCGSSNSAVTVEEILAEQGLCMRCGRSVKVSLDAEQFSRLRPFFSREPPSAVSRYLAARPNGPLVPETTARAPRSHDTVAVAPSFSRYEVLRRIGQGGMAEVYLARQRSVEGFQKEVVIKRILPDLASQQEYLQLFLGEAKLAARVAHPNVVQIYDLGKDGAEYFICMEYIDGWNLSQVLSTALRRALDLPIVLACRIMADVCAGLHAAHTCDVGGGIVHRDVSPQNILISRMGDIKLTDFGVSKALQSHAESIAGSLKGKLAYMAPEQLSPSSGRIGAHTDVFAAGLVFFQALTGRAPHKRETEAETLAAALRGEIPSVSELRPSIPPSVDDIVRKATFRDPSARFRSAAEMQRALEAVVANTGRALTAADLRKFLQTLFTATPVPNLVQSAADEVTMAASGIEHDTVVMPPDLDD